MKLFFGLKYIDYISRIHLCKYNVMTFPSSDSRSFPFGKGAAWFSLSFLVCGSGMIVADSRFRCVRKTCNTVL